MYSFLRIPLIDKNNKKCVEFDKVNLQMYYLFLLEKSYWQCLEHLLGP